MQEETVAGVHNAIELVAEQLLHFLGIYPVVCRASILFSLGANEGPSLNSGNIA